MKISVFEICKIFHYWLRAIADENLQTYLLVTVDTGQFADYMNKYYFEP